MVIQTGRLSKEPVCTSGKKRWYQKLIKNIQRHPLLYIMALPVLTYYAIFHYAPIYGIVMAFQRFVPARGFFKSEWIGLANFKDFFTDIYFTRVFQNTVIINILQLIFGFPVPILFALLLNEVKNVKFKKLTQTITYMPHFISAVVICGIVIEFTKSSGIVTYIFSLFGFPKENLLTFSQYFRTIFVSMNIWQEFGWGSIIYIASLAGIDPTLYEASVVDGASRFKQAIYITLPGIASTIAILLILRIGNIMSLGWEKIILLYNPLTYSTADVISSYVYRRGLIQFDYSYASAVGLFNSVINFVFVMSANYISGKVNDVKMF